MGTRVKIPPETEVRILQQSRRRCCLCACLEHDWRQKKGQIAHLDHDPANPEFDNLVWLCLDHHSEYDSRSSQHKNYRPDEVRGYRETVYSDVADVIARGIEYADDVAAVPFVIATGAAVPHGRECECSLRNYTATPGLLTEVVIRWEGREYRWVGRCVIAGNDEVQSFRIPFRREIEPPLAGSAVEFEVEATDLAEVVTRRRLGVVSATGRYQDTR
jgi:hypothetical protein